jgi:hypothetical protein
VLKKTVLPEAAFHVLLLNPPGEPTLRLPLATSTVPSLLKMVLIPMYVWPEPDGFVFVNVP